MQGLNLSLFRDMRGSSLPNALDVQVISGAIAGSCKACRELSRETGIADSQRHPHGIFQC